MDGSQIAAIVAIIVVVLLAVRARRGPDRGGRGGRGRRPDDRGRDGGVETAAMVGLIGGPILAGDDQDYAPRHGWDPSGVADAGGGFGGDGGGEAGGDGGGGGD